MQTSIQKPRGTAQAVIKRPIIAAAVRDSQATTGGGATSAISTEAKKGCSQITELFGQGQ